MAKKKFKKPVRASKPVKEARPNMFERLGNKKRFDVLGKKVKGDVRNVGMLRSAASEKRKNTLLVEYKQLRKSNAFVDRRFGEDDETLNDDERALMRFQKQRMREMSGSKFTLRDDENDDHVGEHATLTHLGRSLADDDASFEDGGWPASFPDDDDDIDTDLDHRITEDLHFGGGFVKKQAGTHAHENENDTQQPQPFKSKKEVMEEIIAKSKMHKAIKAQQREEDLQATEALDEKWKSIAQEPALLALLRPKGSRYEKTPQQTIDEGDLRFDVLTKELIFEAKAHAGERTLTVEELEELERHRLEELEKQRVKRQRGGDDDEDDFEDAPAIEDTSNGLIPTGGYAARRAKRAKKEALKAASKESEESSGDDGTDDEEDEEDGVSKLDRGRQERAAGDHPLQSAFRDAAAKLLSKHGITIPTQEESGDDSEEESGDEEESGEESDDEESGEESGEESEEESDEEESEEDDDKSIEIKQQKTIPTNTTNSSLLTFTPSMPTSYQQFSSMCRDLSPENLNELLHRIRSYNATALATENKKGMQLLYGCVLQHAVYLAEELSLPAKGKHSSAQASHCLDLIDALVPHILELTAQVPFYAATLARARLKKAHKEMMKKLKDHLDRATAWPSVKILILLKIFAVLFPATDKRHPALTPASLYMCTALKLCPVTRPRDIGVGLYLSSLLVQMHSNAERYVPEALDFAVSVLTMAVGKTPHNNGHANGGAVKHGGVTDTAKKSSDDDHLHLTWLSSLHNSDDLMQRKGEGDGDVCEELSISQLLTSSSLVTSPGNDGDRDGDPTHGTYFTSNKFKIAAVATAIKLIDHCCTRALKNNNALPEIMEPAVCILKKFSMHHHVNAMEDSVSKSTKNKRKSTVTAVASKVSATIPTVQLPVLHSLATATHDSLVKHISAIETTRRPLYNISLASATEARQFNPRYEEGFAIGKDYDPDRERSERRRLQRQLRKEERGAMRELRKDSAFMAGVKDIEKASAQASLDASARRAMSFLEQQEADYKSGGQGGMWKKNKKK